MMPMIVQIIVVENWHNLPDSHIILMHLLLGRTDQRFLDIQVSSDLESLLHQHSTLASGRSGQSSSNRNPQRTRRLPNSEHSESKRRKQRESIESLRIPATSGTLPSELLFSSHPRRRTICQPSMVLLLNSVIKRVAMSEQAGRCQGRTRGGG